MSYPKRRGTYGTPEHMAAEAAVMSRVSDVLGLDVKKTSRYEAYDFVGEALDGTTEAIFEVKCRNNPRTLYPTLLLSLSKYQRVLSHAEKIGKPAFLVVSWKGDVFLHQMNRKDEASFERKKGGRTDRFDPKDIEECLFIPVDIFVPLAKMGRLV